MSMKELKKLCPTWSLKELKIVSNLNPEGRRWITHWGNLSLRIPHNGRITRDKFLSCLVQPTMRNHSPLPLTYELSFIVWVIGSNPILVTKRAHVILLLFKIWKHSPCCCESANRQAGMASVQPLGRRQDLAEHFLASYKQRVIPAYISTTHINALN